MIRALDTLAVVVVGLAIIGAVFGIAQSGVAREVATVWAAVITLYWAVDRIVKMCQRGSPKKGSGS